MQTRAAVINDFSSFGRCSLAVTIPILSAMGVQCCSVPTAFFTNHTGFKDFSWQDNTAHLDDYIKDWQATGLKFDGAMSGFLGSVKQVEYVKRFVDAFKPRLVVIDPVMGDYGKLYSTYSKELAEEMRSLVSIADVLTPNLTEAYVLAGKEYKPDPTDSDLKELICLLKKDSDVVITGIVRGDKICNCVNGEMTESKKLGADRSGTGDVFSSVILGEMLRGSTFVNAVDSANLFVEHAIERSMALELPNNYGLAIEEVLGDLCRI